MTKPSDPLDELLGVPPPDFVAARNKLAAELKKSDAQRAAAIKALPKPSPSVWATNQVARRAPQRIAGFLDASDALERAQTGRGGSDESRRGYQTTLAAQREALDQVVNAARDALTEANLPANRTVLDRVTNDLRWAVLSADTREQLQAGRLTKDLEPPDFSSLVERIPLVAEGPAAPPATREKKREASAATPRAEETAAAPGRLDQKRLDAVRARHTGAREQAERAREVRDEAAANLAQAEKAVQVARRELAAAEKAASAAARAKEIAETDVGARDAQLDKVTAELAAVQARK